MRAFSCFRSALGRLIPRRPNLLSVVMPVHNAGPYLDDAVQSILNQTYRDFEFIILDDGSTDGSTEKLRDWAAKDERIRLHQHDRNLGPAGSSNFVVQRAGGSLIARMDADDLSLPDRLQRQVDLLRSRPDVGLVGTLCNVIDSDGAVVRTRDLWRLTRPSWFAPFPHGSIMYRRNVFDSAGGYREACVYWEDQDFALRMSSRARVMVIPEPLYLHRQSPFSTRLVSKATFVEQSVDLMYRCMDGLAGCDDYEDILERGRRSDATDPRVFISLGSLQLWAGERPRYVGRLLKQGQLKANLRSLSALGWTLWALLSPGTLRQFMRLFSNFRNARTPTNKSEAVEWALPKPLHRQESGTVDGLVMRERPKPNARA